jgi:hypothetical protein
MMGKQKENRKGTGNTSGEENVGEESTSLDRQTNLQCLASTIKQMKFFDLPLTDPCGTSLNSASLFPLPDYPVRCPMLSFSHLQGPMGRNRMLPNLTPYGASCHNCQHKLQTNCRQF